MRIIIDGRMIQESGIGRYIRNLIAQLQIIDKKNTYFILHRKKEFDKFKYQENFHKVLADFGWYGVKEQAKLPQIIKSLQPDLVHFPHFNVPIFYNGRFVVTIHDLIHQHFSMQRSTTHGPFVYKLKKMGYRKVFSKAINNSVQILVPSNFVKDQLIEDWKVRSDKVSVTYEAVDTGFIKIVETTKENDVKKAIKKFGIRGPFIFYIGNAHPHKNIEGLIKAFLKAKTKFSGNDTNRGLQLVLAGYDHYFWQRIKKNFQNENIIYANYVSDKELTVLLKSAECFIMPSLEEGFGIPILEAFACSCPVVSSKAGSLPEIGGNACLYFNPDDPNDMMEKILELLSNKILQKQLAERGLKRYKQFSFRKLAEETLEVYRQCVLQ